MLSLLNETASTSASMGDDLLHSLATTTSETLGHSRPSSFVIWTTGLLFVTLINLCAVVGIGVIRYLKTEIYNQMITLFVALGVGSLSASSFYHLLPQAYPKVTEDFDENGKANHSYLFMAHFAICGVYMFFLCDKFIKIFMEWRKMSKNSNQIAVTARSEDHGLLNGSIDDSTICSNHHHHQHDIEMRRIPHEPPMTDQTHGVCVHDHTVSFHEGDSAIATVAWMIICGDGFHNLIDGISIGAAFSESIRTGVSVSLAVLCEEFPHELGDVAILVASGMSYRQALLYNLLSALTCYAGFGFGVLIGEMGPMVSKCAFALAGGMFLYISLGCMMPEMKKAMEEAIVVSFWKGVRVLILQAIGLFLGISLMYFMARYGEEISI